MAKSKIKPELTASELINSLLKKIEKQNIEIYRLKAEVKELKRMSGIEAFGCYEITPFSDGYYFCTNNDVWYRITFTTAKQFIEKPYKENILNLLHTNSAIAMCLCRIILTILIETVGGEAFTSPLSRDRNGTQQRVF